MSLRGGNIVSLGRVQPSNSFKYRLFNYALDGKAKKIGLLISRSGGVVDIDICNSRGQTALFASCLYGNLKCVQLLLQLGADPNRRSDDGSTPTHAAAFSCNCAILDIVVEHGGDLRLHDNRDLVPRDWAIEAGPKRNKKILELIDRWYNESASVILSSKSSTEFHCKKSSAASLARLLKTPDLFPSRYPSIHHLRLPKIFTQGYGDFVNAPLPTNGLGHKHNEIGYMALTPIIDKDHLSCAANEPSMMYQAPPYFFYTNGFWGSQVVTIKTISKLKRKPSKHFVNTHDLLTAELNVTRVLVHPHILLLMGVCMEQWNEKCDSSRGMSSNPLVPQSFIYERVSLGSLYHLLHNKLFKLPCKDALLILLQVQNGLSFLHQRGLIHCCLSAHSVQLVNCHTAKLSDFYYAVHSEDRIENRQQIYPAFNRWLAPEVLAEKSPSFESDVYSFCVVACEAISGVLPWRGYDPDSIRHHVVSKGHVYSVPDGVPKCLHTTFNQGLCLSRHKRKIKLRQIAFSLQCILKSGEISEESKDEREIPSGNVTNRTRKSTDISGIDVPDAAGFDGCGLGRFRNEICRTYNTNVATTRSITVIDSCANASIAPIASLSTPYPLSSEMTSSQLLPTYDMLPGENLKISLQSDDFYSRQANSDDEMGCIHPDLRSHDSLGSSLADCGLEQSEEFLPGHEEQHPPVDPNDNVEEVKDKEAIVQPVAAHVEQSRMYQKEDEESCSVCWTNHNALIKRSSPANQSTPRNSLALTEPCSSKPSPTLRNPVPLYPKRQNSLNVTSTSLESSTSHLKSSNYLTVPRRATHYSNNSKPRESSTLPQPSKKPITVPEKEIRNDSSINISSSSLTSSYLDGAYPAVQEKKGAEPHPPPKNTHQSSYAPSGNIKRLSHDKDENSPLHVSVQKVQHSLVKLSMMFEPHLKPREADKSETRFDSGSTVARHEVVQGDAQEKTKPHESTCPAAIIVDSGVDKDNPDDNLKFVPSETNFFDDVITAAGIKDVVSNAVVTAPDKFSYGEQHITASDKRGVTSSAKISRGKESRWNEAVRGVSTSAPQPVGENEMSAKTCPGNHHYPDWSTSDFNDSDCQDAQDGISEYSSQITTGSQQDFVKLAPYPSATLTFQADNDVECNEAPISFSQAIKLSSYQLETNSTTATKRYSISSADLEEIFSDFAERPKLQHHEVKTNDDEVSSSCALDSSLTCDVPDGDGKSSNTALKPTPWFESCQEDTFTDITDLNQTSRVEANTNVQKNPSTLVSKQCQTPFYSSHETMYQYHQASEPPVVGEFFIRTGDWSSVLAKLQQPPAASFKLVAVTSESASVNSEAIPCEGISQNLPIKTPATSCDESRSDEGRESPMTTAVDGDSVPTTQFYQHQATIGNSAPTITVRRKPAFQPASHMQPCEVTYCIPRTTALVNEALSSRLFSKSNPVAKPRKSTRDRDKPNILEGDGRAAEVTIASNTNLGNVEVVDIYQCSPVDITPSKLSFRKKLYLFESNFGLSQSSFEASFSSAVPGDIQNNMKVNNSDNLRRSLSLNEPCRPNHLCAADEGSESKEGECKESDQLEFSDPRAYVTAMETQEENTTSQGSCSEPFKTSTPVAIRIVSHYSPPVNDETYSVSSGDPNALIHQAPNGKENISLEENANAPSSKSPTSSSAETNKEEKSSSDAKPIPKGSDTNLSSSKSEASIRRIKSLPNIKISTTVVCCDIPIAPPSESDEHDC